MCGAHAQNLVTPIRHGAQNGQSNVGHMQSIVNGVNMAVKQVNLSRKNNLNNLTLMQQLPHHQRPTVMQG